MGRIAIIMKAIAHWADVVKLVATGREGAHAYASGDASALRECCREDAAQHAPRNIAAAAQHAMMGPTKGGTAYSSLALRPSARNCAKPM
jgi:hypothetical protein